MKNAVKTYKTMWIRLDNGYRAEVDIYETLWGERVMYNGRLYSVRKDGTIY